jgi:hypothetical protein
VTGASALSTDNQAAIVADGDIHIAGTGSNSYFQGLVYSKGTGGILVVNTTVVGTVVSAQVNAPTTISNASVVFNPTVVNSSYSLGWSGPTSFSVGVPGGSGTLTLANIIQANGTQLPPTPANFLAQGITTLTAANFVLLDANGVPLADQSGVANDLMEGTVKTTVDMLNQELVTMSSQTSTVSGGQFQLNLNQFLQNSGQLHIVWKQCYS